MSLKESTAGTEGTDAAGAAAAIREEGELPRAGLVERPGLLFPPPPPPPKVAPASATAEVPVVAEGGLNSPAAPKASLPAKGSSIAAAALVVAATRGGE